MARYHGSGELIQTPLGPIRKLTKTEMEARKRFYNSVEYIEPIKNKQKTQIKKIEDAFPEIHQAIVRRLMND